MHYPKAFEKTDDSNGYFGTAGPLAIPGQIIVPLNATDMGGLPGYVAGVSPDDGAVLWQANMIPGPGEPGYESWPGDSRDYGGAGPWIVGTWDPDLRMYYTGTANAYPFNAVPRGNGKYDNVGAASVVAINTDTGKVPWRYTVVPGDPWDYDTMQTPLIITIDGRKTNRAAEQDRLHPLSGCGDRSVPAGGKVQRQDQLGGGLRRRRPPG